MTHASVFSGIGGPEVAATMLGWQNLFHCEINPFGKQVLDYWYPNAESYDDITNTDFTKWRGRVNVLTGGFPCQPFSYAGQRRGATDDRYLWPHMFRCIDEIRPDWVVAENVAGILTMVEQGQVSPMASQATLFDEGDNLRGYKLRETFTLQRICDDLESHGYTVQPILIPACGVGAPHRRDRVFIVANANERTNRRATRKDAGESGAQRIQERHEVRKPDEPNQVRPASAIDVISDTSDPRAEGMRRERQDPVHRSEYPADTIGEGLEGQDQSRSGEGGEWLRIWRNTTGHHRPTDEHIAGCERWAQFPSVSPVHRGNDGLPFDVDRLTISFGKWRTEALKAYGNAIVPQVMYEIFRAIEIVEQNG